MGGGRHGRADTAEAAGRSPRVWRVNDGQADEEVGGPATGGAEPGTPTTSEMDKRLDRARRLTGGLMVLATFACVVCVVSALLGWYESLAAATVPVLLFGAIACVAAWRLRSLG